MKQRGTKDSIKSFEKKLFRPLVCLQHLPWLPSWKPLVQKHDLEQLQTVEAERKNVGRRSKWIERSATRSSIYLSLGDFTGTRLKFNSTIQLSLVDDECAKGYLAQVLIE